MTTPSPRPEDAGHVVTNDWSELAAVMGWRPFTSNDAIALAFGALAGLLALAVVVRRAGS